MRRILALMACAAISLIVLTGADIKSDPPCGRGSHPACPTVPPTTQDPIAGACFLNPRCQPANQPPPPQKPPAQPGAPVVSAPVFTG